MCPFRPGTTTLSTGSAGEPEISPRPQPPRRARPRSRPSTRARGAAKYPVIAQTWRRHWTEVVPFYAFPGEVRRIIYTTDEIDKTFSGLIVYPPFARVTARRRAGPGGVSPAAQPYRRSSFAAPVRPLPRPPGRQLRTACS